MKRMVAALIIKDQKLLLISNIKHNQLRIEPPGGKVKNDETPEHALIGEVKEEIGVNIKPIELFGIYDTRSPEEDFEVYMYLSKIINGKIRIRKEERTKIRKPKWYTIDDLIDNEFLVPNVCRAIPKLKEMLNADTE